MVVPEAPTTGTDRGHGPGTTPTAGAVTFTLLGQMEVLKNGVDHAPTAPKVLQLLAMLVIRPGRVVPIDAVIDELWGDRPPRSVRRTMQTYVYHLRRCIEQHGLASDADEMLATRPPGYVLRIPTSRVDVSHFRRLVEDGRAMLAAGRPADAVRTLQAALDLWSGPPLANVTCGRLLSGYVLDLQEQRRNAQHLRIEAAMACGAHRELIGELRSRTTVDQLDEVVHGQLMRVLARSGRRLEAMATFRELRSRLTGELGVEPCEQLQSLHQQLLSDRGERSDPR